MRRLALAHLVRAPGAHAVGVQQAVVGVLVVHREQRVAVGQRKELDRVVVHAGLQRLVGGAVARVHAELGRADVDAERIAPARQHLRAVAGRHGHASALETECR